MSQPSRFLLVLFASLALFAHAEIYKWTDANGKVHYSDSAPEDQPVETINVQDINTYENVTLSEAPNWEGFFKPDKKPPAKNVVMYSTARCGYCKQARAYFTKHGIAFTERHIDEDPEALEEFRQLDGRGVPVILVGAQRMNGFNADRFATLYAQETAP